MQTYLVECYWPGVSEPQLADAVARTGNEGETVTNDGVRLVDSILIPTDEIVLCVFEGSSAGAVRAATQRAGLPAERIVESVRVSPRSKPPRSRPRVWPLRADGDLTLAFQILTGAFAPLRRNKKR